MLEVIAAVLVILGVLVSGVIVAVIELIGMWQDAKKG
ncbi:hypothetical protein U27_03181 [Candidatus Vecturithrix granuli]|uniref:Uncharacterized protein n=1 Tax=Vecturithrix granuli TaxID=1499967 RepID=A0A081BV64_VECG1|nr:hypothetical protein U27_03181 [Candidatus Vecturithrix granuli]